MILCLCRAVTDRMVKAAIQDGASSVDAVAQRTAAGTGCGVCREDVHSLLDQAGISCAGDCKDCPRRGLALTTSCETMIGP